VFPHLETIHWSIKAESGDSHWRTVNPLDYTGLRFEVPAEWVRKGNNCVQVLLLPSKIKNAGRKPWPPPVTVGRVRWGRGSGRLERSSRSVQRPDRLPYERSGPNRPSRILRSSGSKLLMRPKMSLGSPATRSMCQSVLVPARRIARRQSEGDASCSAHVGLGSLSSGLTAATAAWPMWESGMPEIAYIPPTLFSVARIVAVRHQQDEHGLSPCVALVTDDPDDRLADFALRGWQVGQPLDSCARHSKSAGVMAF